MPTDANGNEITETVATPTTTTTPEVTSTDDASASTPPLTLEAALAEVEKWKGFSRKNETQAKANAEAARKLQEYEDSQKTELEKAQARAAELEAQLAATAAASLRATVAAAKGGPAELLTGATQEELEASAAVLIAFRGGTPAAPTATNPADANGNRGGNVGAGGALLTREQVEALPLAELNKLRRDGKLKHLGY